MPLVASQKRIVWSYPDVVSTTDGLGMAVRVGGTASSVE